MYEIKTITTKDELKRLFNFLSEAFVADNECIPDKMIKR